MDGKQGRPPAFRPQGQADLAPAGVKAKLQANLAALRVLDRCRLEDRWAEPDEQVMLACWSGWGAVPAVFAEDDDRYPSERDEIRAVLRTDEAWAAARRTTLNAHYTSAEVVQAMWRAVGKLGFTDGRVLEPGCGSGNFLGFAPQDAELVGVELDPTTAEIARQLYGARAIVHTAGFEALDQPDGSFDLTIGNVPFGKVTPFDPRHNRNGHTLHNYFLVKSLHLTRPGGLVVALTSRYTMDARNPAARREIADLADLVGAVRLPAGAFAGSSGTQVVIDLLVLRRRESGAATTAPAWARTVSLDDVDFPQLDRDAAQPGPAEAVTINEYFAERPDAVLGRLTVSRGMYREHELIVEPTGALEPQLEAALDQLVADASARGTTYTPTPKSRRPIEPTAARTAVAPATVTGDFALHHAQEGSLVVNTRGEVGRFTGGRVESYQPQHRRDLAELRRLIGLRDAAREVLAVQRNFGDDGVLGAAQEVLASRYRDYVRVYGSINRFKWARTGRRDPETGADRLRQLFPRMGGFRKEDPDWPLVAALEVFDDETQAARPAPIFTERIVAPTHRRIEADNAADAIAIALDEAGEVTVDRVAELLGVTPEVARADMGELVFDDPETGALVPAATYLSGNVRRKLEIARSAAAATPSDGRGGSVGGWSANVAALEKVLPPQVEPGEIAIALGAPWIPADDVEAFCSEVLNAEVKVERLEDLGRWTVTAPAGRTGSVVLTSEWGTARASAITLLDAALNQRLHTVYDLLEDGRRRRNDPETLAAREKQEALTARFAGWVNEDPDRAQRLAATYNERFCSVVLARHDGSHLSLPGLAATFTPRAHQRDAVARILTDGRALLAHAVGAGKTATMVMAAMELRRLGLVSKPAVVVPNHMLEQFSREWLQLYPNARILIADAARLDKARRKEFVARCATGDWDAIVFTHSGFERIPLGRELWSAYLRDEVDITRRALAASKKGKALSVKKLEAVIAQLEERLKKLFDSTRKDDGVRFEETGVDYLLVDESHAYKNRQIVTSIDGVARKGSKRSQDLDAKLWVLRRTHGPRTVTFATATPVANSMAELWVMQSYLQPDVLAAAGLGPFDSWAAAFGRTHTALELAPDGGSYRMQTRFARFQNLPELLTMYRQVADVRTADQLGLPTPEVADRGETVVVPSCDGLTAYVEELVRRAELIRNRKVRPEEDNMLAVTGDGRRAALDLRLVGLHPDPAGGKIAAAARRIAAIHHATRDQRFADEHGGPAARPGALQLVFCDVSTPASGGWNAYDELRDQLVRRGVPAEAIRFMQDAKNDSAKARLFATCRDGSVGVLIGSTETMGVGTNVQARAVALHHLDAPWRPADIEQRDGRIVRQGNQNPQVEIIRYVTEGSFDVYMWQTLERKAAFIAQVSKGETGEREVDELADQVLSFAEVKALATGDPRIMEKAGVDAEVARLTRLEHAYLDDQRRLQRTVEASHRTAEIATAHAERLEAVLQRTTDTSGDRFTMAIDGHRHTKRIEAGEHLVALVARETAGSTETIEVGHLAGLDVHAQATFFIDHEVQVTIPDADVELRIYRNEWPNVDPLRLVQRLERAIREIPTTITKRRDQAESALDEAARANSRLGQPWEHATHLTHLRARQHDLNERLTQPDEAGHSMDGPASAHERALSR